MLYIPCYFTLRERKERFIPYWQSDLLLLYLNGNIVAELKKNCALNGLFTTISSQALQNS